MADVSVGKLLPNLKVTLGNDAKELESPDEKNLDISPKLSQNPEANQDVEIVRSWMESLQNPKVYKNKSGGFTTGLDLVSEENIELLSKRAERFGLEKEEESPVSQNISALYESFGVTAENKHSAKVRLDALHIRGVNELNTNEIFDYFKDYGPASVEWINDFACNVVWLDEATCARALLGVSKPINTQEEGTHSSSSTEPEVEGDSERKSDLSMEVEVEVEEKEKEKSSSSEMIPAPPGPWRLGIPHPKAKSILLRFATKDDKKLPGAEKRSNFYKKYGNPNYGGLRGLISSSRKRKMQAASNRRAIEVGSNKDDAVEILSSEVPVQRVSQSKPPRMRMYADDEELKTKKLRSVKTQGSVHSRQGSLHSRQGSVHSRLGNKYTQDELCNLGWDRSADSDDLRAKIRKMRRGQHRSPLCQDDF